MHKPVQLEKISRYYDFSRVLFGLAFLLFFFFRRIEGIRGFLPLAWVLPLTSCTIAFYLSCRCLMLNASSPGEAVRCRAGHLWIQFLAVFGLLMLMVAYVYKCTG